MVICLINWRRLYRGLRGGVCSRVFCGTNAEFIIQLMTNNPGCIENYSLPGCFTGGKVVQTFVAVMLGAMSFGTVGPAMAAVSTACASSAILQCAAPALQRLAALGILL